VRHLCALICFLFLAVSVSAFEIGLIARSESDVSGVVGTSPDFAQLGRAELSVELVPASSFAFRFSGGYQYILEDTNPLDWDNVVLSELLFDFESSPAAPQEFALSLGRFRFEDATGRIYNDQVDGALIRMRGSTLTVHLTGGYTGFLFDHDNSILASNADAAAKLDTNPLGPPRVVVEALGRAEFPRSGLALTAAVLAQFDLHAAGDLAQAGDTAIGTGGAVSTQYQTLSLDGTLADAFRFGLGGTINTGQMLYYDGSEYAAAVVRALLAEGTLVWAPYAAVNPEIGLELLFASGDEDATSLLEGTTDAIATAFTPVSRSTINIVTDPFLANLFRARAAFALQPLAGISGSPAAQSFRIELGGSAFFQPTSGVSSFDGVTSGFQGYVGTELGLQVLFEPFSFLHMDIDSGVFLPAADAFASSDLQYRVLATVHIDV
jgi:hypothetical protein